MIQMKTNLNEYYFGGNSALVEGEKALDAIRALLLKKGFTQDVNQTPEHEALKNALCDVFGFEDMLLDMTISGEAYEIFTMPAYLSATAIKNSFTGNKNVTTNKYGVCFTKDSYTVPYIRFNPITLMPDSIGLTSREAMAILIHEIGHNFFGNSKSVTVFKMLMHVRMCLVIIADKLARKEPINPIEMAGNILTPLLVSSTTISLYKKILTLLNKTPVLGTLIYIRTVVMQFISIANTEILGPAMLAFSLLYYPIIFNAQTAMIGIISMFNLLTFGWLDTIYISYNNEKFSDNFATTYGYGPDIASGLVKMERYTTNGHSMTLNSIVKESKSEVIPWITTLVNYPNMVISHALMDCHPNTEARIIDQGKMLRAELKRQDLKPETKKRILKDIEELDKIRKDYFETNSKDGSQSRWRKEMSRSTIKYGGDIREKINPTESYDWEALTNAITRGKKDDKDLFKGL